MKFINILYVNLKCLVNNEIRYNKTSIDTAINSSIKNRYAIGNVNG